MIVKPQLKKKKKRTRGATVTRPNPQKEVILIHTIN